MLKGLSVPEAEMQLQYLPGRAVRDVVLAVLKSAVANAEHNVGLQKEALKVASVVVDSAFAMKRFRPASRGVAHPYVKRTSHITVTLEPRGVQGGAVQKKKSKSSEIATITADQYAAEALDDDPAFATATAGEPKEKEPEAKDVPKSKEQQTFGKMRGLQGGGDKKKAFRRKSMG